MYVDDPTATYRGYRRQALYALFRLFDNTLPNNAVIQPEGNEDLAIYDYSGTLIEIVQVKDHTANLAVSSFKPSFYQRIASYCSPTSPVVVRIASYGPIGPDLQKAVEGNSAATHRVLQTITKKQKKEYKQADGGKKTNTILGLPESEARNIINRLTLTEVDETILTDTVVDALGKTSTGVDAKHAFEFLMWWLITSSETQLKIDRTLAIEKINRIGKFVAQRASYHDEWHTSIIPIGPSEDSPVERDALADEFFRGGRVRFDHINADIDIPRDRFLKEIHSAFGGNNVVVMHSASGQGKTSLAYRYAKEFAPAEFRFEVSPAEDLRHARLLALALMGHVEAIEVPTLVYVDVKPGDDYWVEIVQQLSSVAGIRVLVTIREEDWSRTRTTGAEFSFAEVILSFDQDEARLIYDCLTADDSDAQHLDFDDAWQQFGEKKALFEFVYYLTQAESLADRIAAQITFLQDAVIRGERSKGELELLRLVAVASAYEARVDLVSLVDCCDLVAPERTLERFNNEYLIRVSDDGRYVEGFHSIRSTIITQELTDPVLHPWTNVVCRCLPLIVEDDLENFLLCAFSRHVDSAAELLAFLDNFHPRSWVGIRGVVTSVMWNSLSVYTEQNASILEEVFDKTHDAWYLTLDWDLAQVYGKGGFQVLENWKHISPEYAKAAEYAQSAREQQTDKDAIFLDLRRWLKRFSEAPSTPTNIGNFAAMAEVLFWVGHLDIQTPLRDSFTDHVLDQATDELPIHLLGEFILGIRIGRPDLYDQWHSEHSEHLTTRIRQEAAILALVEDDEAIVAHYIIDTDQETSRLRQRNNFSNSTNTLHESTLERIELLSQVFAGKKRYGAIGYGHRTSIVRQIVDEAEKPGVMAEYLHPPWAPRFNALARGLVEHRFRPDSWTEYFSILQTRRQDLLSALDDLRRAITAFNPTRKPSNKFGLQRPAQWDECRNSLGRPFLLPKVAVDEWGFTTESTEQNRTDDIHRLRYPALNRLSPIRDAVNEYTRTVGNFMSQALDGLVLLPNLHMADDPSIKANVLAKAAEFGLDEQSVRLSIVNGVDACAAVSQQHTATYDVFGSLGLPNTSGAMSSRELQVFLSTVTSWCTFTYGGSATRKQQVAKKAHLRKPKKNNRQKSVSTQPGSFSDLLNPTRNRLRSALQGLKRDGIEASILSETIPWNGKSALWISCNTEHPLASLAAIEKIWHRLVAAFGPDRDKIVRVKAIDLLWSEIILVPLVSGKSLEGHALPHFRGVANVQEPDLEQNPWYFFPEIIPEDAWDQLRLKRWEANSSWSTFDQFTTAYGMLCQHVDHLADFKRLRAKLDELGISILQSHIDNEMLRIQPLSQEVLDSCSKILNIFNETDLSVAAQRDNLIDCRQILVEIKDYLLPMQDFYQQADLSLGQLADWSNRLRVGLQILGVARSLWIADTLHFSEYNSVNELGLIHG